MKYQIKISAIRSVDEIASYWTEEDYRKLLELFDVSDIEQIAKEECRDYLFMAISDFADHEAASILLSYKLSEKLTAGQIEQLSHEMIEDKVAEEYPDISLHEPLFHVNQLLYKAYNGTFPNTKASIIDVQIEAIQKGNSPQITKGILIKALQNGLKSSNIIKRLFEDQIAGQIAFKEAEYILWDLRSKGPSTFQIVTSDYWLNREDFTSLEFEGTVVLFEEGKD